MMARSTSADGSDNDPRIEEEYETDDMNEEDDVLDDPYLSGVVGGRNRRMMEVGNDDDAVLLGRRGDEATAAAATQHRTPALERRWEEDYRDYEYDDEEEEEDAEGGDPWASERVPLTPRDAVAPVDHASANAAKNAQGRFGSRAFFERVTPSDPPRSDGGGARRNRDDDPRGTAPGDGRRFRPSASSSAASAASSTTSSVSSRHQGRSTYLGFFRSSPRPLSGMTMVAAAPHRHDRRGGGANPPSAATMTTTSSFLSPAPLHSYYEYRSDQRRKIEQETGERMADHGSNEADGDNNTHGDGSSKDEEKHQRRTPKSRGGGGGGDGKAHRFGDGLEGSGTGTRSPSSLSLALQEVDEGEDDNMDEDEQVVGNERPQGQSLHEQDPEPSPGAASITSKGSAYLVAPYWRHAFGEDGVSVVDNNPRDDTDADYAVAGLLGSESDEYWYENDENAYGCDDDVEGGYETALGQRWLGRHQMEQEILFSRSYSNSPAASASTPRSQLLLSASVASSSASGLAGESLEVAMGDGAGSTASQPSHVMMYSPPSTAESDAAMFRARESTSNDDDDDDDDDDADSMATAAAFVDPYPTPLLDRLVDGVRSGIAAMATQRAINSHFLGPTRTRASQLPHLIQLHRQQLELHHFASHAGEDSFGSTSVTPQEHWDFCLVLQPQQVYGYWAQLLDFRSEFGIVDPFAAHDVAEPGDGSVAEISGSASLRSSTPTASHKESKEEEGFEISMSTPLTGLRRRNASSLALSSRRTLMSAATGRPTPQGTMSPDELHSVSSRVSNPATRSSARKSVFERALMSPHSATGTTIGAVPYALYSQVSTPSLTTTHNSMARRRWGASSAPHSRSFRSQNHQPSLSSPPIHSISRGNSTNKVLPTPTSTERKNLRPTNPNVLRMEDIPQQRMARGVAARTHGLVDFLSALKRGIVVRLHSPNHGATLVRLVSTDGGDTIRYTAMISGSDTSSDLIGISTTSYNKESLRCLAEQRMRYHTSKYQSQGVEVAKWSLDSPCESSAEERAGRSDENSRSAANTFVPDYVAAQRHQQQERRVRFGAVIAAGAATARRQLFKGTISAADIAVVHPATFADPRCPGDNATSTLRRSKSSFNPTLSFSLVMRNDLHRPRSLLSHPRSKTAESTPIDEYETKWLQGQGSDALFKYFDIECATLGEYWLLFRGFLLLHRDVAVGRFAAHRAAGIGSHYSRIEIELARGRTGNNGGVEGSNPLIQLHENEFHEPATAGCWERWLVSLRGIDPTYLHGYVLETAKDAPPSDYFLGFVSAGTAIWSRLRQAGLETSRIYSLDPNRVLIKVRCPTYRLLDVAEVLKLKIRTQDGSYVPFSMDMMDIYPSGFLRSSLRQSIIDFIIGSRIRDSGAELARNTTLGKSIQARVPLHMRDHLQALFNGWFYFWKRDNWSHGHDGRSTVVPTCASNRSPKKSPLVEHADDFEDSETDASASGSGSEGNDKPRIDSNIPNAFTRLLLGSFYQPLDSIEDYFGEKVAFYFAWLQHTACHLIFLAITGLIVFAVQVASGNWDHPIRPLFSLVVMLWTFFVLTNWRKRANFLAHRWGTMNYHEQETTRPQFHGDYVQDDITGEWVITYPRWKRWLKYTISVPLTLLVTFGSISLIVWVHSNREEQLASYMVTKYNATDSSLPNNGTSAPSQTGMNQDFLLDPTYWYLTVGIPSLLGLFLPLVNLILMRISVMLNDFENYKTESEYRTHLIVKVFSFRFVCYFATLYYYAYKSARTGTQEALESGMFRVASGVLVYTTVTQWWQNFLSVGFPIAVRSIRMRLRKNRLCDELYALSMEEEEIRRLVEFAGGVMDDGLERRHVQALNKRLLLEQAQDPMWLEVMLPLHDSFPEYIQAVVQFTYVACFSVALPITPMIVLFNYLVGMRLDAYKICKGRRRPLAEKTGGIGIWEHLLHIVSVIGVLTNCWLVGFTSHLFREIGESVSLVGLFAIVVGWEHVMLLIKYIMQTSISSLPLSVANSIRREQHELEQQRSSSIRIRRLKHQREEEAEQQRLRNLQSPRLDTPAASSAKSSNLMSC